jgi:glyoxylase-like metal-dependent hydrolase (beta-lactamase superfamily II)
MAPRWTTSRTRPQRSVAEVSAQPWQVDEIGQDVFVVRAPFFGSRLHLPVLVGREGVLVVDSGAASTPNDVLLPALGWLGLSAADVRWVVISHAHADHAGGVGGFMAACPGARLIAGEADARAIADPEVGIAETYTRYGVEHLAPYPHDVVKWVRSLLGPGHVVRESVRPDEPIDVDLGGGWTVRVLAIPGHTYGHASVWDPRSATALLGDGALWRGCVDAADRIVSAPPYVDAAAYRRTAAQLADLRPERLVTAHYADRVGRSLARDFLDESAAFSQRCAEQVALLLERGEPIGVLETAAALDAEYGPMNIFAQWYPVALAELELLTNDRRAEHVNAGGRPLWRATDASSP